MFPNYCFTKSTKQHGFDILKRSYTAKDGYKRGSRPSERSPSFSRNLTPRLGMRYADVSGPEYLGRCNVKHSKRKQTRSSSIKNMAYKPPSALKPTAPPRNVAFRLPAVVCVSKDSMADTKRPVRVSAGDDKTGQRHCDRDRHPEMTHDPNQELQESFADFFSIIHDNVLETVQGAVEKMVSKCFEESIAKMERLSSEMQLQEKLLNKMFRDINAKIDDQNETSLNQFKFITQMLIDSQTVHYRALNQAKFDKRRHHAERDYEKEREHERERIKRRSTGGNDENEPTMRGPQHQLWQQQDPHIYHTERCQPCMEEECKKCRPSPPSEPSSMPRLQNGTPASSMPNLSKQALFGIGSNRAVQPEVQSLKSRLHRPSSRNRASCQEPSQISRPVLAYPPCFRSNPTPRRRVNGGSSVENLQKR
ncbi:uncharacterized protein LOC108157626 isoform X1 [Drosophila miranda]|uniref:uncharacterized protein LOC108157626 isoform X1 n=1 Tax=Drosophila miranda TaxID=7229 RepID=UPI0007E876E0|nr:uncharacterized protein LOC108157626 isoform X1 [Drosophila miranda]